MLRVLADASRELAAGFALTGVDVNAVADSMAALEAIKEAAASRDYGIIIVEEALWEGMDARSRDALHAWNLPLVVAVPAEMKWMDVEDLRPDDHLAGLIRHAVGHQLAIKL